MTATPKPTLDERIAAAFAAGVSSHSVGPLIQEAEVASACAGLAAEDARERALDPALSAADVAAARRDMDDAAFRRDRMNSAATKLRQRLTELKAQEEDDRRRLAYENAKAERDKLIIELKEVYPQLAPRLADLVARIEANDRELQWINTRERPNGAETLVSAEVIARDLGRFDRVGNVTRITGQLRLPAFEFSASDPYHWPRG